MKSALELPTPSALIDLSRLEKNVSKTREKADALGVRLRPHVKTHKCLEIARIQTGGCFGGITVSTLGEAEFFAEGGFTDITYAVPVSGESPKRILDLAGRLPSFHLLADHLEPVERLESAAFRRGLRLPLFLKVDCGYHRAGVDPASKTAVALAGRIARSPHLALAGLLTHAGHSYACRNLQEIRKVARQEVEVMLRLAERLQAAGIDPGVISIGSTPTLAAAENLDRVDEIRPGNYVFYDRFQAAIGSCRREDIAFAVLATVIGVYPDRNRFLLDSGATALSKDPGIETAAGGFGFGTVHPLGDPARPEIGLLTSLSQEHGLGEPCAGIPLPRIGEKVLVLPNHSCLAAGLFERYCAVRNLEVQETWRPCRGW